jgi:hypothetical protein
MLAERAVALQESNLRLTQTFFSNWIEQVNNQTQVTREATQNLQEQGQRQREAFETLSQEATNAYSEFLNSGLSFYQEALSTATQVARGNMQQSVEGHPAGDPGWSAGSEPGGPAGDGGRNSGRAGGRAGRQ